MRLDNKKILKRSLFIARFYLLLDACSIYTSFLGFAQFFADIRRHFRFFSLSCCFLLYKKAAANTHLRGKQQGDGNWTIILAERQQTIKFKMFVRYNVSLKRPIPFFYQENVFTIPFVCREDWFSVHYFPCYACTNITFIDSLISSFKSKQPIFIITRHSSIKWYFIAEITMLTISR